MFLQLHELQGFQPNYGQDALVDLVMAAAGNVNTDGQLTLEEINAAQE